MVRHVTIDADGIHLTPAEAACLEAVRNGLSGLTRIALEARLNLRQTRRALECLGEARVVEKDHYNRWRPDPRAAAWTAIVDVPAGRQGKPAATRAMPRAGTSNARLLARLNGPVKGKDLRQSLGISKQRLLQIVVELHAQGCLRVADYDNPTFRVAPAHDGAQLLPADEERLLSAMPVDGRTSRTALGALMSKRPPEYLDGALNRLMEKGLVAREIRARNRAVYRLTRAGERHPQRDPEARKAKGAPAEIQSERTVAALDLIARHGPVRPASLATELGIPKQSANALMQYFKRRGFVCKGNGEGASGHVLTPRGRDALATARAGADADGEETGAS